MAHTSCLHLQHSTSRTGTIRQHQPCRSRSLGPFTRHHGRPFLNVRAHSTEAPPKPKARPGEKKGVDKRSLFETGCHPLLHPIVSTSDNPGVIGFVEEMRFVAMKLHTKDQAPKEGGKEAAPQPFQKVQSTDCLCCCHAAHNSLPGLAEHAHYKWFYHVHAITRVCCSGNLQGKAT